MESGIVSEFRSTYGGDEMEEMETESLRFSEELQRAVVETGGSGSSFTSLLELPANQAVKLLHSPETETKPEAAALLCGEVYLCRPMVFPADTALIERASDHSTAAFAAMTETSPTSAPVKEEPTESPNSTLVTKSTKRKDRGKKVKPSPKKIKPAGKEDSEQLPYVHVRARRGQATDSHSLAERARREKINARMKLLQELVPGCNKISGTTLVLDEIINHVQSLQRQVEFLSMSLVAVNPRIDINLDSLFSAENESLMGCNITGVGMPSMWEEGQLNGNRQPYQQQQLWHLDGLHPPVWGRDEGNPSFTTPENSLLSYDSSANSDKSNFDTPSVPKSMSIFKKLFVPK